MRRQNFCGGFAQGCRCHDDRPGQAQTFSLVFFFSLSLLQRLLLTTALRSFVDLYNVSFSLLILQESCGSTKKSGRLAATKHRQTNIMPVELRKRKAPVAPPAPAPSKKKVATKAKKPAGKAKDEVKKPSAKADKPVKDGDATESAPEAPEEKETVKEKDTKESTKDDTKEESKDDKKDDKKKPAAAAAAGKIAVGDVIDLEGFGGEIQTNDGETTSLKKLLDDSKSGIVLFTYPKASTPGCKCYVSLFFLQSSCAQIASEYATNALPLGSYAFTRALVLISRFFLRDMYADLTILRHQPSVPLPRLL